MNINIKGTGIEMTPAIRGYVDEKIGGLAKLLENVDPSSIQVDVEVGRPSQHHRSGSVYRAEVNISVPGSLLRAEKSAESVYAAIDEVKDEIGREIKRYKDRQTTVNRRQARSWKKANALSIFSRFRKKK